MPTMLKTGHYDPSESDRRSGNELIPPTVYVDGLFIQVLDEEGEVVVEFTYEELRGIMAIMEAEQDIQSIRMLGLSKNN